MNKIQQMTTLRDSLESQLLTPEQLKAKALGLVRDARDTIKGSGSISEEIRKVGDAYFDLPIGLVTRAPKACFQLLSLQPVKATSTVFEALGSAAKDIAKITVAPIPIARAAAKKGLNLAKDTASAITSAPIRATRVVSNGCNRVLNLFETADIPKAPPPGKSDLSSPGTPMAS